MSGKQMRPVYRTKWKHVVVVCRKCGKRLRGGFGDKGRNSLKSVLRQTLREGRQRREIRVLETSCLGICPKHGVIALDAGRPDTLHVIPAGADPDTALATLLGDDPSQVGGVKPAGLPTP